MVPMHPRPGAVIFDFDGTLADTFPLIVAAWNGSVGKACGREFTAAEVIAHFGVPDAAMIRRAVPAGPSCDAVIDAYHAEYESRHAMVTVFDGAPELLLAARRAGLKAAVMTGKGRRTAAITLRALGWDGLLDSVVTGDDVKAQKPHPEGPLRCAREVAVKPANCVFVGDSPADILAGKAAGMRTVAAGWHPVYLDELRKLGPDYWAEAPADVARLLGADLAPSPFGRGLG